MEEIENLEEINVPNIVEVLHRKTRRIQRLFSGLRWTRKKTV